MAKFLVPQDLAPGIYRKGRGGLIKAGQTVVLGEGDKLNRSLIPLDDDAKALLEKAYPKDTDKLRAVPSQQELVNLTGTAADKKAEQKTLRQLGEQQSPKGTRKADQ